MRNNIIDIKRSELNAVEPVSLDEAKAQAIVTFTDDDDYIDSLITMARKAVENYCNISIVTQTVSLVADLYNEYELPYGPVTGIASVQTRSTNEGSGPQVYQTATTQWGTDGVEFLTFIPGTGGGFNSSEPFRGYFQWGPYASPYGTWPGWQNRYKIVYTTGYSVSNPCPEDLRQAILVQCAYFYEHRGEEDANKYDWKPGVCEEARILADSYKRQAWL